jgi:hypothetical protein
VGACVADIYNEGFDAMTFVAELADVKKLFISVGRRLMRIYRKRGKALRNRDFVDDWLTARYGFRPLYYDIKELIELCENFTEKRERYSKRKSDFWSTTSSHTYMISNPNGGYEITTTDSIEISLRGCVTADVSVPKLQFNLLQTGWELFPFSFLIDWFITIGQTLAAWNFLMLRPSYAASWGCSIEIDRTSTATVPNFAEGYSGSVYSSGSSKGTLQLRVPCTVPYSPHFTVKLSHAKIIDMLALIVKQIR